MCRVDYKLELQQAIAKIYEVFAVYPLNSKIVGCPCCVTQKDNQLIQAKVSNKLTAKELNRFAFKAMNTWGTINDFKHFLPRLFELAAFDSQFLWSSTVIDKLEYAEFNNWAEPEQLAVNQYLVALWNYILSKYPNAPIYPDELIPCLIAINNDIDLFLLMWQNHSSINSLLHLSDFIRNNIRFNESPIKIINFYPNHTEKFLHWLTKSGVIKKLEQSFFDNLDECYAERLAIAVDTLNYAIKF